jgi:rhodanese-related sulfurtransferase
MTPINIVDVKTLAHWLGTKAVVIDVREPSEYHAEHIRGAVNLPLSTIINEIVLYPEFKGKFLVFQCLVGKRSMLAIQKLQAEGYTFQMWNLDGGLYAWKEAGFEVVSK